MESSKSLPTSKDFPVPYVLQEALGVYSISINERKLTIKYKKNADFKGDISFVLTGDLESTDRNEIGLKAIKKGFTTENAELLKTQMCLVLGSSPEAIDMIAEIKAQQKQVEDERRERRERQRKQQRRQRNEEKKEQQEVMMDETLEAEDDSDENQKAKKALVLATKNSKELFVNEFSRPFAAMIMRDGHIENHPMDETKFKNWISAIYYERYINFLSDDDLKKIVRILTARAEFDGNIPKHRLDIRVRGYNEAEYKNSGKGDAGGGTEEDNDSSGGSSGGTGGSFGELVEGFDAIYYDLTNKKWEAIKITAEGWDIDRQPPILFRRFGGEVSQPYPDRKYDPDTFDKFMDLLNLKPERKKNQVQLLKPLIVTYFWPNTTPKPGLMLPAAQGSAKTTAFELIRDVVDPNVTLTTSLPKEDFNLKQSLSHNFVSFFDNVSDVSDTQSDTLCRGITGAGDVKRKLYENDDDIIYSYRRIIGLNGITNAATRPDLLDRGLIVEFGHIPRLQRKLLRIIRRKAIELKPKLLAFCFDVISEVMAERQKWKGKDEDYFGMEKLIQSKGGLPRMADWAILAEQVAAVIARKEGKDYTPGQFLEAFDENLESLNIEAIKSSLVAEALIAFMTERETFKYGVDFDKYGDTYTHWEGSPTLLLANLTEFLHAREDSIGINVKSKAWPQSPSAFGKELAGIAPNLRTLGIIVEASKTNKNTLYTIAKLPPLPPLLPPDENHAQNEPKSGGGSGGGSSGGSPPLFPPLENGQNRAQNDDSGSSGSKTPTLRGQSVLDEITSSSSSSSEEEQQQEEDEQ